MANPGEKDDLASLSDDLCAYQLAIGRAWSAYQAVYRARPTKAVQDKAWAKYKAAVLKAALRFQRDS